MAPSGSGALLEMDSTLAATMVRLLSMFAELPSTPPRVADEAAATARDVSLRLPFPPGFTGGATHRQSTAASVAVERGAVVSSAGLLGMLAGMPSTPPDLRAEAEDSAERLWRLIDGD